jgi:hypothetical protein
MVVSERLPNKKIYLGISFLIIVSCYLITLTPVFSNNRHLLSYAILADLLITLPLVYLFLIKNSTISKLTVFRVVSIGIAVADVILNVESNQFLYGLKHWIAPIIETVIIFTICYKFYRINKKTKERKTKNSDFLIHSRVLLSETLGNNKIGEVMATEVSMFYYAFLSKKNKKNSDELHFTSYKENGIIAIFYAFMMAIVVETVAMHFLLMTVNPLFAWVLTGLSLYTCIQLFSHIRAITSRVIRINYNILALHMGLAADAEIQLSNIKSIKIITKEFIEKDTVKISLLKKLEPQNIIIELYETVEITKLYGIKRYSKRISFFVDEPKIFYDKLKILIA